MSFAATLLLGAIAGLTIFLGLPIARIQNPSRRWQAFLNAVATGILVFLLWDVISEANETIETAMESAQDGHPASFIRLLAMFVGGFAIGLLALVSFESRYIRRTVTKIRLSEAMPTQLAFMIAVGLGLHNLSEGLAIGQASRVGEIGLATVLIIGFGLHNATEGFGIAAPLAGAARPSWSFLALTGLIGGGPTFLGTLLGYGVKSDAVFVLFLAMAAGSILYVIAELLHVGRRFGHRTLAVNGILVGFMLGYGTDLILSWTGA
jgi:ZIP family zinc transporter